MDARFWQTMYLQLDFQWQSAAIVIPMLNSHLHSLSKITIYFMYIWVGIPTRKDFKTNLWFWKVNFSPNTFIRNLF